jgi:hypothetical protein
MPCEKIDLGGGDYVIVCGPRGRRSYCAVPQCGRYSEVLCDYPVKRKGKAGTCDMKLCLVHAKRVEVDRDYCPAHFKLSVEVKVG